MVEVGIDLKTATIMVVLELKTLFSQLHQLRGRVGRGKKGYFYAISNDDKIKIIEQTNDGFKLRKLIQVTWSR